MKLTAQEIADAALKSIEDEDLLIEVMCRAICGIEEQDPDQICEVDGEQAPYWRDWEFVAKSHLVCDRIMRGPGDRMAYERVLAADPEAAEAVKWLEERRNKKEI